MGMCMISLALTSCLTLSLIFDSIQAQNEYYSLVCSMTDSPKDYNSPQDHNSPQDYLDAHNSARATVGVDPLTWDNIVAAYAQNYANKTQYDCSLVHSGGPYGENLAMSTGKLTGVDAVNLWVEEKSNYVYNSNSCAGGEVCGHYTQVVWRNSIRLGCARVQCNNGEWFVTCNYDPPGNIIRQRPY